jgi:hypothetical protein
MGAAPPPATGGASGLPSDDTHELGGDAVDEDEDDTRRGDVVLPLFPLSPPGRAVVVEGPPLALDRPILRNSNFDALPLFLLIVTVSPPRRRTGFRFRSLRRTVCTVLISVTTHRSHATVHLNGTTCVRHYLGRSLNDVNRE